MDSYIEIFCEIKHITSSAVLINDGTDDVWVPRSQIQDDSDLEVGENTEVLVAEWLAIEKGLV